LNTPPEGLSHLQQTRTAVTVCNLDSSKGNLIPMPVNCYYMVPYS